MSRRDEFGGPPLTPQQQRVLGALVALCPDSGCDVQARAVAEETGMRLGSVVVILQSLAKRRLVLLHDGEPEAWAPTMTGRGRVRHHRAMEERARTKREEEEAEREGREADGDEGAG